VSRRGEIKSFCLAGRGIGQILKFLFHLLDFLLRQTTGKEDHAGVAAIIQARIDKVLRELGYPGKDGLGALPMNR
jgi:hypothetical protein